MKFKKRFLQMLMLAFFLIILFNFVYYKNEVNGGIAEPYGRGSIVQYGKGYCFDRNETHLRSDGQLERVVKKIMADI